MASKFTVVFTQVQIPGHPIDPACVLSLHRRFSWASYYQGVMEAEQQREHFSVLEAWSQRAALPGLAGPQ
jgi:hypothetical protein